MLTHLLLKYLNHRGDMVDPTTEYATVSGLRPGPAPGDLTVLGESRDGMKIEVCLSIKKLTLSGEAVALGTERRQPGAIPARSGWELSYMPPLTTLRHPRPDDAERAIIRKLLEEWRMI